MILKSTNSKRLVLLRDDHLGDMILTTPLVESLSSSGWTIDIVGKRSWAPVWNGYSQVRYHHIEDFLKDGRIDSLSLARWMRRQKFSHLFIPYHATRFLWASFFSGVRKRYCQMGGLLGRVTLHRCLRARLIEVPRPIADAWQDFARAVGVQTLYPSPRLKLEDQERVFAKQMIRKNLPEDLPLVVVHPFHGKSSCNLPLSSYVQIVRNIVGSNVCNVVVTGSQSEAAAWKSEAPDLASQRLWVSCGQLALREFFSVISLSDVLLASSTGALHVGSAFDIPSVSLFCPHPSVSPQVWGSLSGKVKILAPEITHCPRYTDSCVKDCGFAKGFSIPEITGQVLRLLENRD